MFFIVYDHVDFFWNFFACHFLFLVINHPQSPPITPKLIISLIRPSNNFLKTPTGEVSPMGLYETNHFTVSLSAFPETNLGTLFALIFITSPV
jgi:hypothetical protein